MYFSDMMGCSGTGGHDAAGKLALQPLLHWRGSARIEPPPPGAVACRVCGEIHNEAVCALRTELGVEVFHVVRRPSQSHSMITAAKRGPASLDEGLGRPSPCYFTDPPAFIAAEQEVRAATAGMPAHAVGFRFRPTAFCDIPWSTPSQGLLRLVTHPGRPTLAAGALESIQMACSPLEGYRPLYAWRQAAADEESWSGREDGPYRALEGLHMILRAGVNDDGTASMVCSPPDAGDVGIVAPPEAYRALLRETALILLHNDGLDDYEPVCCMRALTIAHTGILVRRGGRIKALGVRALNTVSSHAGKALVELSGGVAAAVERACSGKSRVRSWVLADDTALMEEIQHKVDAHLVALDL